MSTPKPEKNGSGTLPNVTYEQRLLTNHTGLDSLPGFVVTVFERLKGGGARFLKLINTGEVFRHFNFAFWDSPENYFAIAVNKSRLRYTFEAPVSLDDHIHKFTLIFHLTYRTANPRTVAELADQDPLLQLRNEIAGALVRSCAKRNWEMIKDRFRELELIALNAEQPKLRQFAATVGIEIVNIELDSRLPQEETEVDEHTIITDRKIRILRLDQQVDEVRTQAEIAAKYQSKSSELEKQLQIQNQQYMVHRAEQYQQLLDRLEGAIGKALEGVGEQIDTPAGLMEAFDTLRNIYAVIKSDQTALAGQASLIAGSLPVTPQLIGAGEDKVAGLLTQTFKEIAQAKLTTAQKRALTSNILHVTAEALLDDDADEEVLKNYSERLSKLASTFDLTKKQYRELHRFQDYKSLCEELR